MENSIQASNTSRKITGVRNVDFHITATGEGVVNHNGAFPVYNKLANKMVDNHLFPKMRGLDPLQRIASNGAETYGFNLDDPRIGTAKLIVSSECVRSHLFKDASFGIIEVNQHNVVDVLSGLHGLVRGYLITRENVGSFARKSPLYVTDFECEKPNLLFNQGINSKAQGENANKSMYSYFKTDSNLTYTGKASLSIEDLQFIPLENTFERSAYDNTVTKEDGENLAKNITQFLQEIGNVDAHAKFVMNAVRVGSVCKTGEAGILLNDAAISIIVDEIKCMLESLYIRQSKGYVQVQEVLVDFNDSNRVFRSINDPSNARSVKNMPFARYYIENAIDEKQFKDNQAVMKIKAGLKAEEKKAKVAKDDADKAAKKAIKDMDKKKKAEEAAKKKEEAGALAKENAIANVSPSLGE